MIEVKVPADLKSIRATSFGNLTRKELFYGTVGFVSAALLAIWGSRIMHQELVYLATMLVIAICTVPIILERSNKFGISAEEFIVNAFHFIIAKKNRPYENEESLYE